MSRPVLLDAFCGAGGATKGYQRAGFHVVGVDIAPQPNYCGDEFVQADALEFLAGDLSRFAAIHASPPCQAYSTVTPHGNRQTHPDLYLPVKALLERAAVPWVIENVIGSPYRSGFVICGSMFGMKVRRHRNFECSFTVLRPPCDHKSQGEVFGVYGDGGPGKRKSGGGQKAPRNQWPDLMGMPWATWREAAQAIPPAYTEWVGNELMRVLEHAA